MEIKPSVLIVDDELGARQSLEVVLEDRFQVVSAENGKQALEILRETNVDVVLLDVHMPDMDGLEVLQRVKELDDSMDVIMVSALNLARKAVDAIKLGAYDYITKPYEPEDLISTVDRAISKQKLHRQVTLLRREVEECRGFDQIIGQHKKMLEIFDLIRKVAYTSTMCSSPARAEQGRNSLPGRSIAKATAGITFRGHQLCRHSPELMESELFGHERSLHRCPHPYDRKV
jgi:DNA-binding NtrC family response regulator